MGFTDSLKKLLNMDEADGNKVLVTGGLGYIGSHTVVELIEQGYQVCIVDNLSNSNIKVLEGIEKITEVRPVYENIDVCDFVAMDKFLTKNSGIKSIIHFAAYKAVGESVEKPLPYFRNNLQSMVTLLELMPIHHINNLVFSSSCTVYGQPDTLPVNENSPIKPALSPYGATKQMCEEIICDTVAASKGVQKATLLRYFNPIGAHPTSLIGELPNGVPNNLLPFVAQTAAGIRKKLKIFGNDYNTPDGSCIRDYIDVVDLAKAHLAAMKRMESAGADFGNETNGVEVYNIGTGRGLSVIELVEKFEAVNGIKVPHEIAPRREGDIEQIWADATLANTKLGWKAEVPIEDTLRNIWQWQIRLADNKEEPKRGKFLGGS